MKLTATLLVFTATLLGHSAAAFFIDLSAKSEPPAADILIPAAEATAGPMAKPLLKGFSPLRFVLAFLGIPVEQLVEASRKCVAELGPETVEAVKSLLGSPTLFG